MPPLYPAFLSTLPTEEHPNSTWRQQTVQKATERKQFSVILRREQENTPFDDLTLEFGIQKAMLHNRFCGMKSRQKAHEDHQVLSPSMGVHFYNGLVNRNLKDFLPD